MKNIMKNMLPYKKVIFIMILLLIGQAYCEMSLPQYTEGLIDTGIQNKGIEHIIPEKTTANEYEAAQIFMSDKEKQDWQDSYTKDGDIYKLNVKDQEKLSKMDDEFLISIVMTYKLGHTSVKDFKSMLKESLSQNPQTKSIGDRIDDMSIDEIGQLVGSDITTFKAKDENDKTKTYVDVRPVMQKMIASGQMNDEAIKEARKQSKKTIDSVGDKTLKSMGVAYAGECDKAAGMDLDKIQKSYLWDCARKMLIVSLVMLAAAALVSYIAAKVGANIGRDLRGKSFKRVMSFSSAEMDKFQTSSLITRATNDIQQVQFVSTMMMRMVFYAPILGIWGIVKVAQTGAHMNWVIVMGVAIILSLVGLLMAIALPKFRIMQKLVDALNAVSREILTGLQVIRAFGREKTEEARFDIANMDLKKTQLFTNRVMSFMMPAMMIIMNGLVVLITWVSAHRIDEGVLQVGAMTAFITYSMIIVSAFMIITVMSIMLPRAGVAADRIAEVIGTESSIVEKDDAEVLDETGKGEVRFSHVDFMYPNAEENVLSDIDFVAKPGETTAIIGSTGSGKSTLVNLIPRFYDVTGGSISIDGKDIKNLKIDSLRKDIGFVPQKGVLFSGTIASNIKFGNENASDDEVREAAEIAQATEFIDDKEEKYESFVSQGGGNVSGGQKQRLSIARAIAKKPKVLVFDDSFSALDMKTDAQLRHVLQEKEKDATKIIVAQRISTIVHAEQILVLDEGKIIGRGKHDELMECCDVYKQIAESQLSNVELEGIE